MSKRYKQPDQRGAVALITAMLVSILLMITTAGMVSLTVKSLRQSSDGAQTTKAYYAAEGGLEKALLQLRRGIVPADNCAAGTDKGAVVGTTTCVRVLQSSNEVTGELAPNQTAQIDLSAVDDIHTIKIEWGLDNYDGSQIPDYKNAGFTENLNNPTVKWGDKAPAVIEAGIVKYPDPSIRSEFAFSEVGFKEAIFSPKSNRTGDRTAGYSPAPGLYSYTSPSNGPVITNCSGTAPYQCFGAVGNLQDGERYVLRLRSRYNSAKYRLTVIGGTGNKVLSVPNGMYTVDVTARAGDTFRRVRTSFSTVPQSISNLDYVLYSDTDICKAYQVKASGATELDTGLSCLPN